MATWERIRRNGDMSDFTVQLCVKKEQTDNHVRSLEIQKLLNECNVIKYAAYRTGAKLLVLQRTLYMKHVSLKFIAGVFCRHRLDSVENGIYLTIGELEAVVSDIYFGAQKETQTNFDVDLATQLMTSLLKNVYDKSQYNTVQVISAKILLVVLSTARLQDKYQYIFNELADHNNCISRKKLESLLHNLTLLMDYLHESPSFGPKFINSAIQNCFQGDTGNMGITEDRFNAWILSEPEILTWLSTMYRIQAADKVTHLVKCRVCKSYPVSGLLYQCLQCLSYSQCQTCFFLGRTSKKHKLKHPVQEYCSEISTRQSTRMFWKVLLNRLWKTSFRLQYLHVEPHDAVVTENGHEDCIPVDRDDDQSQSSEELELSVQTVVNGSRVTMQFQPQQELSSIISHLEEQNRNLEMEIEELCKAKRDAHIERCIRTHRTRVERQINRLKVLQCYMLQLKPLTGVQRQIECFESTPVVTLAHRLREAYGVKNISPILRTEEESQFSLEVKNLREDRGEDVTKKTRNVNKVVHFTEVDNTDLSITDVTESDLSMWYKDADYSEYSNRSDGLSQFFPKDSNKPNKKLDDLQKDLDVILVKLDKMLDTSLIIEDEASCSNNTELQATTSQVQDILSGLIDQVEESKNIVDQVEESKNIVD